MAIDKKTTAKPEVEKTTFNDEIMKLLQSMQSQIGEIKAENDILKNENETLKSVKASSTDRPSSDDLNQIISIRNMYDGMALVLKINDQGTTVSLDGIGVTLRKRLVEILDICRLNRRFAEKGYFIIEDRDIVERYFPEMIPHYEKFIDKKILGQLGQLENDKLVEIFKNANDVYKSMIIDKFIEEWAKGEDINFMNMSKIQSLSNVSGINVMAKINGMQESESLTKEFANR